MKRKYKARDLDSLPDYINEIYLKPESNYPQIVIKTK